MTVRPAEIEPIQAVLFDLDNTLYDRDYTFGTWARGFIEAQFVAEDEESRAAILQELRTLDAGGHTPRAEMFRQFKARYPILDQDVPALCDLFSTQWLAYMALDAETENLLDRLDEAAIPYGIITNGTAYQNLKIQKLALEHRLCCLFVSGEFGYHKPDAAIFQAAAACMGLPCAQILFVGDNPEADICGAQRVGMRTAWIHRGKTWPAALTDVQPDIVISTFGELVPVLDLPEDRDA
jgi:putative hydrolase of the HAD superfamily